MVPVVGCVTAMRTLARAAVAVALLVTPAIGVAAAPYTYWVMGAGNVTARTGWPGTSKHTIALTAKVGLMKLTFSEKHNKPIWLRAEGRPISNQGGDGEAERKTLSDDIGPMGGADLSVPTGSWIRGIEVCSQHERDDADRQIRGMRVVTARATDDGRIVLDAKVYEDKAAGCKDWAGVWARCEPGEVARGVHALHNGKWYTGLQLICGPLEKK
jgi:hypothetical protein